MQQVQCYLEDTYRFCLSSVIMAEGVDERGAWLALRDNLFHPQGGGQPADSGWVNEVAVGVSRQSSGLVILYPAAPLVVAVGDEVQIRVAQAERQYHAALHTAGHLLNWQLREYGWLAKAGHHFPGESRVEFVAMGADTLPLDELPLAQIEAAMHAKMTAGLAVDTRFDGETRYCLIAGTEEMPCAGTHVASLNQLAGFSIKSVKLKKGTLRISYDAQHAESGYPMAE